MTYSGLLVHLSNGHFVTPPVEDLKRLVSVSESASLGRISVVLRSTTLAPVQPPAPAHGTFVTRLQVPLSDVPLGRNRHRDSWFPLEVQVTRGRAEGQSETETIVVADISVPRVKSGGK